jgi:hypothetical protein
MFVDSERAADQAAALVQETVCEVVAEQMAHVTAVRGYNQLQVLATLLARPCDAVSDESPAHPSASCWRYHEKVFQFGDQPVSRPKPGVVTAKPSS